jgi:hypothetical protein
MIAKMITKTMDNCYVAMLDVLGFKDLVDHNSHEELLKIYERLSMTVNDGLSLYKFNQVVKDARMTVTPDLSNTIINSMTISDSIVLWTNDTSAQSFYDLLLTVRFILFYSMHAGIPLRGGIGHGPLSIITGKQESNADNQQITFIGKSIVKSYSIEQSQEWSGCIISKECMQLYQEELKAYLGMLDNPNRMNTAVGVAGLIKRGFVCQYKAPRKKGEEATTEYVINWPSVTRQKISEKTVRNSFAAHNKSTDHPKVQAIIQNTIDFFTAAPLSQPLSKWP